MSDELTTEQIAELRRLRAAARPGAWDTLGTLNELPMVWDGSNDAIVSQMPDGRPYFEPDDAAFIAAAYNAFPALLDAGEALTAARAEVARLTAERDDLKAKLTAQTQSYRQARSMWPEGDTVEAMAGVIQHERQRAAAAEAALSAERETAAGLRAMLFRYGAHDPDCAMEHPRHAEHCTCGFAAALAAVPGDENKE